MFFRKAVCLHVALDRGHCPMQFYSVLTIPGVTKTGEPLMRMGLQDGRAGTYDFPTLAPRVARRTQGAQAPRWGRPIHSLRQSTLASCLARAIHVEDKVVALVPVP